MSLFLLVFNQRFELSHSLRRLALSALLEAVELVSPEVVGLIHPVVNGFHLISIQAVEPVAAPVFVTDTITTFQDAEVRQSRGRRQLWLPLEP